MTPRERAMRVYEEYRTIILSPPSKRDKAKSLVQLISEEIKAAIKADRKERKKR